MQDQGQQPRQRQRGNHPIILDAIARLRVEDHPQYREDSRHKLIVNGLLRSNGHTLPRVDRRSLQHMVDFLDESDDDSREVVITELELHCVRLKSSSLSVLRKLFARSDTRLKKVTLDFCEFVNGDNEDDIRSSTNQDKRALQLLSAFQTNRIYRFAAY
jgi:hypothetical protein